MLVVFIFYYKINLCPVEQRDCFLSSGKRRLCTFDFLQQGKEDRLPGDLLYFHFSRPHESQRGRARILWPQNVQLCQLIDHLSSPK